jgi:hypothetical protein
MESIVYFEEYRQWEWFTWCLMPLGVGVATCGLLLLAGVLDPCFRSLHKSAAEMWIAPMRLDAEPGSAWARALQWMDFEVAEEEGAADGGGGGAFTAPLLFDQEQRSGSDQRCVAFPRGTGCANGRDGGAAALPPGARDCPRRACVAPSVALRSRVRMPLPSLPAPPHSATASTRTAAAAAAAAAGGGYQSPAAGRRGVGGDGGGSGAQPSAVGDGERAASPGEGLLGGGAANAAGPLEPAARASALSAGGRPFNDSEPIVLSPTMRNAGSDVDFL